MGKAQGQGQSGQRPDFEAMRNRVYEGGSPWGSEDWQARMAPWQDRIEAMRSRWASHPRREAFQNAIANGNFAPPANMITRPAAPLAAPPTQGTPIADPSGPASFTPPQATPEQGAPAPGPGPAPTGPAQGHRPPWMERRGAPNTTQRQAALAQALRAPIP